MSPPICKPDKSNGLEFRFDLPFSCQASAKTLLHLVLFSSMCRLIPYLVPGGPSANTESASDFPTGGFIRFFRRCSQQVEESRMWRPKVSFSRLELDVDFEIGQRCQSEKVALGDWYKRKRIRQAYFRQSEVPTRPSVRRIHRFCLWAKVSKLRQSLLV